jgi:ketosteroid isomerase-like protein
LEGEEPAPTAIEDLIRGVVAAYADGGFDAVLPFGSEDIEVYASQSLLNAGASRGADEVQAWNSAWEDAWGESRYEIGEIELVGDDRAVAQARVTLTGRSSGITTEMRQWWFFEMRDGKIARWHLYPDRDQAFAAAGGQDTLTE